MHGKLKVVKAYTEDHLIGVTVATLFFTPLSLKEKQQLSRTGMGEAYYAVLISQLCTAFAPSPEGWAGH